MSVEELSRIVEKKTKELNLDEEKVLKDSTMSKVLDGHLKTVEPVLNKN